MTDQEAIETLPADDADAGEETEVEGFTAINTTRSNIKNVGGMTTSPAIGGIGGKAEIAIKEQGIK
ncbi:MAG: hypothetical protein M3066_12570 [Actinomycetota bacterium]|nr:hypothetical protein [Actinomycetota bacterium]